MDLVVMEEDVYMLDRIQIQKDDISRLEVVEGEDMEVMVVIVGVSQICILVRYGEAEEEVMVVMEVMLVAQVVVLLAARAVVVDMEKGQ